VYVKGDPKGTVQHLHGLWYAQTADGTDCGACNRRCDAVRAVLRATDPELVARVVEDLGRQLAEHDEPARPCTTCGGTCRWSDDAWCCVDCGDEWSVDAGPQYAILT
jgi:hypothetical protein